MRYHLTPVRMASIKTAKDNKCWWGYGAKRTLVHCWWEYKLEKPLWKTVQRFLKKLKIELPYDPAIPHLGIYLKEMKSVFWRDICTPMFIAALFTIAKIWKQPKCLSMDEWIQKIPHNGILFSHKQKEILPFVTTWVNLEDIMLSDIIQTEKNKCCMTALTCGISLKSQTDTSRE